MDTSRETVLKAIEFRQPRRLPVSGYGRTNSDTLLLMPNITGGAPAKGGVDEWGCVWSKTDQKNIGQVTGHPLQDLGALSDFSFPDPHLPERFTTVRQRVQAIEAQPESRDKFRIFAIWNTLWERMHMLYGFENCLCDLMEDENEIHQFADRILDWCLAVIEKMAAQAGKSIDAFYLTDDWGTQTGPMISPKLFEHFFLPRYRQLFSAVHAQGWKVWMHSCGRINDLIPLLIDAGVDVLNMQQPRTNDIEEIGRRFSGKVAFETLCDIQTTLPIGNVRLIAEEAKELMNTWGTPEGGFILGDYGDAEAIGVTPDVKEPMLQAFREHDPWRTPSPHGHPLQA